MSWSINFIGKRENLITAIQKESERLTGQSKEEFDAVKPIIINLVEANYHESFEPSLRVVAAGHKSLGQSTLTVSVQYSDCQVV